MQVQVTFRGLPSETVFPIKKNSFSCFHRHPKITSGYVQVTKPSSGCRNYDSCPSEAKEKAKHSSWNYFSKDDIRLFSWHEHVNHCLPSSSMSALCLIFNLSYSCFLSFCLKHTFPYEKCQISHVDLIFSHVICYFYRWAKILTWK